jgi:hypothetical protein
VVKHFTLTNTNDKTRSIGSTFIWQLKYCFQWQAYFSRRRFIYESTNQQHELTVLAMFVNDPKLAIFIEGLP